MSFCWGSGSVFCACVYACTRVKYIYQLLYSSLVSKWKKNCFLYIFSLSNFHNLMALLSNVIHRTFSCIMGTSIYGSDVIHNGKGLPLNSTSTHFFVLSHSFGFIEIISSFLPLKSFFTAHVFCRLSFHLVNLDTEFCHTSISYHVYYLSDYTVTK